MLTAAIDKLRDVRPRPFGPSFGLHPPSAAPRVRQPQQRDGGHDLAVDVGSTAAVIVDLAVATVSVIVVLLLLHQQQQLLPNELRRRVRRLPHVFPLAGYR